MKTEENKELLEENKELLIMKTENNKLPPQPLMKTEENKELLIMKTEENKQLQQPLMKTENNKLPSQLILVSLNP
jgi:hypothetical protein